jgi:hypothetical protein
MAGRERTLAPRLVVVLALAVLAAGCTLVGANSQINQIMRDEGVRPEGVGVQTRNGVTQLTVSYRTAAPDLDGALLESRRLAKALWERAPVGFDVLRLEPGGVENLTHITMTSADLAREFGPRPERKGGGMTGGLLRDLAVIGLVVLLAVGGLVTLVVVLVRGARRKARPSRPPPPPPGAWPPPPGRW